MNAAFKLFGPKPPLALADQTPRPAGFPTGPELLTREGLNKLRKIAIEKDLVDILNEPIPDHLRDLE